MNEALQKLLIFNTYWLDMVKVNQGSITKVCLNRTHYPNAHPSSRPNSDYPEIRVIDFHHQSSIQEARANQGPTEQPCIWPQL
jgi:hypothetical protein